MAVCPVCDLQIEEARLKPELTSEYQGLFYIFCSRECQERFENDPQRYANSSHGRHWLEDVEQGLNR